MPGEHKGSVHVRRARKRPEPATGKLEKSRPGADKDAHKRDKDCLFGPADATSLPWDTRFFPLSHPFHSYFPFGSFIFGRLRG
ncbi:hypothetical protein WN55_02015 [Dufourea novaeangliae]|uniref:Uncharacterized protein n=1 Tax=Dufourea novaeangliae TaxID=178035 RepID=A0A154NWT3_DUFNO|nr:hypothetical protein WN55_02015 [Dufourea novaeangliae]